MPVKRNTAWYYFCVGEFPLAVNSHTLHIGNWVLETICGRMEIAPIIIDFIVDQYPINFEVSIEPQGEYLIIEIEDDDRMKEDATPYKNLWLESKEALLFTGRAESGKEIMVHLLIEEIIDAEN